MSGTFLKLSKECLGAGKSSELKGALPVGVVFTIAVAEATRNENQNTFQLWLESKCAS